MSPGADRTIEAVSAGNTFCSLAAGSPQPERARAKKDTAVGAMYRVFL